MVVLKTVARPSTVKKCLHWNSTVEKIGRVIKMELTKCKTSTGLDVENDRLLLLLVLLLLPTAAAAAVVVAACCADRSSRKMRWFWLSAICIAICVRKFKCPKWCCCRCSSAWSCNGEIISKRAVWGVSCVWESAVASSLFKLWFSTYDSMLFHQDGYFGQRTVVLFMSTQLSACPSPRAA